MSYRLSLLRLCQASLKWRNSCMTGTIMELHVLPQTKVLECSFSRLQYHACKAPLPPAIDRMKSSAFFDIIQCGQSFSPYQNKSVLQLLRSVLKSLKRVDREACQDQVALDETLLFLTSSSSNWSGISLSIPVWNDRWELNAAQLKHSWASFGQVLDFASFMALAVIFFHVL